VPRRASDPLYDARVPVLDEYIRHHVKEEESELFPACRKSGMDMAEIGCATSDAQGRVDAQACRRIGFACRLAFRTNRDCAQLKVRKHGQTPLATGQKATPALASKTGVAGHPPNGATSRQAKAHAALVAQPRSGPDHGCR
jgi:hypothetical protein